jgi:hypothetical protein
MTCEWRVPAASPFPDMLALTVLVNALLLCERNPLAA